MRTRIQVRTKIDHLFENCVSAMHLFASRKGALN